MSAFVASDHDPLSSEIPAPAHGNRNLNDWNSTDGHLARASVTGSGQVDRVRVGPETDRSADSGARDVRLKKSRSTTACLACRSLKVRCIRGSTSQTPTPCHRCAHLGVACEIPKCRRGRLPGSKNKHRAQQIETDSLSPETAPFPDAIQNTWVAQHDTHVDHGRATSHISAATLNQSVSKEATGEVDELNLPVESAHQSPDPEDSHMQDGPHPLSLLSDIGSRLRSNENEGTHDQSHIAPGRDDLGSEIGPGWTSAQLRIASARKQFFFRHGLSATKRDTLPYLDPISKGYVTEEAAEGLVRGFFQWLQPQVGIMDPALHTVDYMRKHSALLLTSILAASAQTRQRLEDRALALSLYSHAERIYLVVLTTNAKSAELIWALLILYLWPKFPKQNVDDRSRIYLTLAISMAIELGFPNSKQTIIGDEKTRRSGDFGHLTSELSNRRHRDKIRAWTALYIHDRSLSTFSGRPPMITTHVGAGEMRSWLEDDLVTHGDHMIVGYLELRAIENDARNQLGRVKMPCLVDTVKTKALGQIEAWTDDWCLGRLVQAGPYFAHVMHYVSLHISLLIATKGSRGASEEIHRTEVLRLARSSIRYFLLNLYSEAKYTIRTVSAMIAWDAIVYLKLAGRSGQRLVRSVGLAMAPCGDERMDYTAAHFYGSLLIELSFAQEGDIFNKLAQPHLISPSNLWLLNRPSSSAEPTYDIPNNSSFAESLAALANEDMANTDENLFSILGGDLGMGDLLGGLSETASHFDAWPAHSDQASTTTQMPTFSSLDIFSGTQGNTNGDSYDTDVAWSWLLESSDSHSNVDQSSGPREDRGSRVVDLE